MTGPGELEEPDGELEELADEIDRVVADTRQRLAGGELERRREAIMARVRERRDRK